MSLRGRLNNELATFDHDGKLRPAPAYELLRATIQHTGAKLVTLDNVAHLFAGNENDRSQVTAFVNLLYRLCGDLGVTILLIAHRNKAGDAYSGSTAWLNAVRSQLLMERTDDADADVRRLSLGKANYARQGESITFRWHDFALVRDEDLPPHMAEELARSAVASGDNATFLACLEATAKQGLRVSANPSPSYAPARFEDMPEAKGLKRERLTAAMKRLLSLAAIEQIEFHDTAKGRLTAALQIVPRTTPNAPPNASRTLSPNDPEQSPRTTPQSHSPSTKGVGAAFRAAPPTPNSEPRRDTGAPILAPEDIADGGMGGLDGWPQHGDDQ